MSHWRPFTLRFGLGLIDETLDPLQLLGADFGEQIVFMPFAVVHHHALFANRIVAREAKVLQPFVLVPRTIEQFPAAAWRGMVRVKVNI